MKEIKIKINEIKKLKIKRYKISNDKAKISDSKKKEKMNKEFVSLTKEEQLPLFSNLYQPRGKALFRAAAALFLHSLEQIFSEY